MTSHAVRTPRGLVVAYLLIAAASIACYELLPSGQMLSWAVLGLSSVAAVAVGLVLYRPRPAVPWVLLGASLLVENIGDLVYQALGGSIGGSGTFPFPSAADAVYVFAYPLAIGALLGFVRRDTPEYRRGTLLDALIVTVGLGALTWSVFVVPYTSLPHRMTLAKVILIVYLLGDTLVLALAVQLSLAGRLRSAPVQLLLLGALGDLYSDSYFALSELHPSWPSEPGEIIGYAALYVAWGLAALPASMTQVAHPPSSRPWAFVAPRTWTALLCCAALISPTLIIIDAYRSTPRDIEVLAGCCVALFVLVFARLLQAIRVWRTTALRRETERYLHTLIADTKDAIIVASPDGAVRFSGRSAQRLFGDELGRRPLATLFSAADRERVARCFDRLADPQAAPDWPTAVRVEAGDGRTVRAEARWSDLRADPTVRGIALTLRDVTEERRLEDELRRQALTDPLTGLANRQGLRTLMLKSWEVDAAQSRAAGLLMVDLDDFKEVNDTLGHPIGDEVLVEVARRITHTVRDADTVARLGGDEFAVLMAPGPDGPVLEAIAQRLVDAFDEPLETGAGPLRVTASLGLAVLEQPAGPGSGAHPPDQHTEDPDALLRAADLALYAAKSEGKHLWRRYDEALLDQAMHRAELRSALDEALALGTLSICYQPIVSLDSRQIAGFEALARWPHPTLGLLGPDTLIPLAEETGQILELGRQMLRMAVRQAVEWSALGPGVGCFVGVNVSVHQLRGDGFVEEVRDVLAETGTDPRHVVLEVVETALLSNDDVGLRERLQGLRDLGVSIALDDFGTGYGSLISLCDMPIDIIKVDKSFTGRLPDAERMRTLMRGLLTIGDTMGIHTMAEGVETWEQHELLLELGARSGQGLLYSRPVSTEEASALWVAHRPLPVIESARL